MTLVEVMIALVILSVGLLGLAGLQVQGLRGTSGSNSRVQAIFIISDMAERMHANPTEVSTGFSYQNVNITASNCGAAPTSCNGNGSNCSPTQLATHDNFEVCQTMATNLPPGSTLTVKCINGAGCIANDLHTLVLSWNQVQDASIAGIRTQSITMQIQP